MPLYSSPEEINSTIMEFWDKDYDEIFLSMAGLANIWEGPVAEVDSPFMSGAGTILATKVYNDKIFIAQGGGASTLIKVLSPNGVEIYDLGSQANLITHTAMDVYGSMAVINDYEIILGYLYINLKMLFMAPYGIDLSGLWRNPAVKIVPVRVSSSSWIVGIRDSFGWSVMLTQKEGPENCLPCETKEEMASEHNGFSCSELQYGRHAMQITGYKASRSMLASGASLSVSNMGGYGKMERIKRVEHDNEKCFRAIDAYSNAFNRSKISPTDVGEVGQQMSTHCSKIMYLSMLQIVEYKARVQKMYNNYIADFISGTHDNEQLIADSEDLLQLIAGMLGELKNVSRDSTLLQSIFTDQIWWGPIWFTSNKDKIRADSDGNAPNAYTLLHTIKYEDFVDVMIMAAAAVAPYDGSEPLPMGWVIMAGKNRAPVKYGKDSMTYFRFPFSVCTSTRTLFTCDNMEFKSICEVETRADGTIIWAWDDRSTLWNKQYLRLKVYKVSNDGVFLPIGELDIGYAMSPVDDAAKSVGISPDKDYWIVRDYYLIDSVDGGIGYVETKVAIPTDMQTIYNVSSTNTYANCNEMHGPEGSSTGTMKYDDGLLETKWEKFDLDDDRMDTPAWGNNGPQYTFVAGYTGYQIHSASEL